MRESLEKLKKRYPLYDIESLEKIGALLELSVEDLVFLYETKKSINDDKDSKVNKTDIRKRAAAIFECREEQIAFNWLQVDNDTVCYIGDLDLSYLKSVKNTIFPKILIGDLKLYNRPVR